MPTDETMPLPHVIAAIETDGHIGPLRIISAEVVTYRTRYDGQSYGGRPSVENFAAWAGRSSPPSCVGGSNSHGGVPLHLASVRAQRVGEPLAVVGYKGQQYCRSCGLSRHTIFRRSPVDQHGRDSLIAPARGIWRRRVPVPYRAIHRLSEPFLMVNRAQPPLHWRATRRRPRRGIMQDIAPDRSTTATLAPGQSLESAIDFAEDTDMISVYLSAGQLYAFDLLGKASGLTLLDPLLKLLNADLTVVAFDDDSGVDYNARIALLPTTSGTYYLEAASAGGGRGTYRLAMAPVVDDFGQVASDSGHVTVGSSSIGTIDFTGDRDWFRVDLTAGTAYSFQLRGEDSDYGALYDPKLALFDGAGTLIELNDDGADGTLDSLLSFISPASGTYYLQSSAQVEGIGKYSLSVTPVDGLRYIASNADLIHAFGADASAGVQHFLTYGSLEGRSVGSFDGLAYLAAYPDLIQAFGADTAAAARHYIEHGFAEGRTVRFDAAEYLASYPDLIQAFGADTTAAARHYIEHGFAEGRTVSFDAAEYLASNPDVLQVYGADPHAAVLHYVSHGYAEGRTVNSFDPLQYAAASTDLAQAFGTDEGSAMQHFLSYGFEEGRVTGGFDTTAYLLSNADLSAAGLSSDQLLFHWLTYGADEGRVGDALFGREQTGHTLSIGGTVSDRVDATGDHDWFALSLTAGKAVEVQIASGTFDPVLTLFDGAGRAVSTISGHDAKIDFTPDHTGQFYLVASALDGMVGTYTLGIDPLV
jgi:hypothetical protein